MICVIFEKVFDKNIDTESFEHTGTQVPNKAERQHNPRWLSFTTE